MWFLESLEITEMAQDLDENGKSLKQCLSSKTLSKGKISQNCGCIMGICKALEKNSIFPKKNYSVNWSNVGSEEAVNDELNLLADQAQGNVKERKEPDIDLLTGMDEDDLEVGPNFSDKNIDMAFVGKRKKIPKTKSCFNIYVSHFVNDMP